MLAACAGGEGASTAQDVSRPVYIAPSDTPQSSAHSGTPFALVTAPVPAMTPRSGGPLTLQQAVKLAVADNPGLAEIRARADALAAIPSQVGTLSDPVLSLNALNFPTDTFNFDQEPMTQVAIGLSQELPFPGKLGLREEAAGYEAEAVASDAEEKRLMLIRDVKLVWWNLFYLDRALEIVDRNQDLLRQFVEIASAKYEVGQGLQQDVLLAQVELSQLLDRAIRLTGMRRTEEARLNALLNRTTDVPIALPTSVATALSPSAPEESWFRLAEQDRPLLAAQKRRIDAADSRLELARKDYYPDFKVGAAYGFRGGSDPGGGSRSDFASLLFSMNLPVFTGRKQDRAVDQRHAEVLQRTYAMQDSREQVFKEISTALADYRRAREQFELLEGGTIPQAQQTVASMLAGYQTNQVDFLNLVRAQITLYNFEIQRWNVLSVANQSVAQIAAATGQEDVAISGSETNVD